MTYFTNTVLRTVLITALGVRFTRVVFSRTCRPKGVTARVKVDISANGNTKTDDGERCKKKREQYEAHIVGIDLA